LIPSKVDIWSLGCVVSEVAVWVINGPSGVKAYREARCEEIRQLELQDALDAFHDGKKVLQAVTEEHKSRQTSLGTDPTTKQVLGTLMNFMLLEDPSRRLDAQQLTHQAEIILASSTMAHELENNSRLQYPGCPIAHSGKAEEVEPPRILVSQHGDGTGANDKSTLAVPEWTEVEGVTSDLTSGHSLVPLISIVRDQAWLHPTTDTKARGGSLREGVPELSLSISDFIQRSPYEMQDTVPGLISADRLTPVADDSPLAVVGALSGNNSISVSCDDLELDMKPSLPHWSMEDALRWLDDKKNGYAVDNLDKYPLDYLRQRDHVSHFALPYLQAAEATRFSSFMSLPISNNIGTKYQKSPDC
jgi:hypothetical protein